MVQVFSLRRSLSAAYVQGNRRSIEAAVLRFLPSRIVEVSRKSLTFMTKVVELDHG